MSAYAINYHYDDHTSVPFKLVRLKPSPDGDRNTPAHRHNYYELFIFTEGGGEHLIDFAKLKVREKSAHLVPPGSVHLLRRDERTKGYVLLFSREFYFLQLTRTAYLRNENILNFRNRYWEVVFEKEEFTQLVERLECIARETESERPFQQEIICHELNLILYRLMRNVSDTTSLAANTDLAALELPYLISRHFREFKQVQQYCNLLNISSEELNKQCKAVFAKTASVMIQEQLLLESKRLFLHSDLSIKEIAYSLGMEDPSYYSKWIKKMTGENAKILRASLRQLYH